MVKFLSRGDAESLVWKSGPGARFSKARETFRARKAIFISFVSKNGEAYGYVYGIASHGRYTVLVHRTGALVHRCSSLRTVLYVRFFAYSK